MHIYVCWSISVCFFFNRNTVYEMLISDWSSDVCSSDLDWAEMLQRMYMRWAEKRGMKVELVEYQAGEQAGIKSATMLVKGENAYGYAKTESGVHRLVRISPYDSSARRHTSFSRVWVYPVIDDNIEIEINEGELQKIGRD